MHRTSKSSNGAAKTAEYLAAATGQPSAATTDHSDFIKEYEEGRA